MIINAPPWLAALKAEEVRYAPLQRGSTERVWHARLAFQRYPTGAGTPRPSWHETYGKTLIVGEGGEWTVAELVLVERLRAAGWNAAWFDAATAWCLVRPQRARRRPAGWEVLAS
jgi:hypothetical protein